MQQTSLMSNAEVVQLPEMIVKSIKIIFCVGSNKSPPSIQGSMFISSIKMKHGKLMEASPVGNYPNIVSDPLSCAIANAQLIKGENCFPL